MNLIRVPRDDGYIAELLHYLRLFWSAVRDGDGAPPDDFFWKLGADDRDERGGGRYRRFLQRTKQIGESTRVERHITRPWRRKASGVGRRFFVDD